MVVVDEGRCVGCGRCVPFCPQEALRAWGILEIDIEKCTDCFLCIENCPTAALSLKEDLSR